MLCSIKVYADPERHNLLFKREFDEKEGSKVRALCHQEQDRGCSILFSWFVVVRTGNGQEFLKDFFLPSFFTVIHKVDDIFIKMLVGALTIFVDLATLTFRIATLSPRLIYHHLYRKESHPFYQYLAAQGVAIENLAKGYVYLDKLEKAKGDNVDGFARQRVKFHFAPHISFLDNTIPMGVEFTKKGEGPEAITTW